MNVIKKVIALIVIAVIIIRAFTIETFALAGAPVIAAEEITALLETALVGSGLYTESELEGKSYLELNDLLRDGISKGHIDPKANYYTDPISGISYDLLDFLSKPEIQVGIGITNSVVNNAVGNAVNDWFYDMYSKGEELYDAVKPTFNIPIDIPIDMQGNGCVLVVPFSNAGNGTIDRYRVIYGEYGLIKKLGDEIHYSIYNVPKIDIYDLNWNFKYSQRGTSVTSSTLKSNMERYGDWRFEDGSKADTDDESIPVIGEVAGTQVTPDMLNPDGTVTIGGTTYYPKDFIDWDKFKDPAIIDLLNKILAKIDDMDVAEPDNTKDLVDSITDSVEISVPDELSDYMVPTGISSVFPFCLPFDLYRGIKLLSAKPVAPVLEIPFEVPEFGLFKGYKTTLTIEFEKYDKYFSVFRWGTYLIFAFGLIFITTKIVKGANE